MEEKKENVVETEKKVSEVKETPKLDTEKEEKKRLYITIACTVIVMFAFGRLLYGFYLGFRHYDERFETEETTVENTVSNSGLYIDNFN